MKKKLGICVLVMIVSMAMAACEPSQEKLTEAQTKYSALVEKHNTVVEEHKEIEDDSLDAALAKLEESVNQLKEYNLAELSNEEIDVLVEQMDALSLQYDEKQAEITKIKNHEDTLILTDIELSVKNAFSKDFQSLYLYEKGSSDQGTDLLADLEGLKMGEVIDGLIIEEDVDQTPWILVVEDTETNSYEIEIDMAAYEGDDIELALTYDEAAGEMVIQTAKAETEEETEAADETKATEEN